MVKFICYHKLSLFLHKHESFTKKLITLSRIEINVQLDQTTFTPNHWKRVKKSSSFYQLFEKRSNSDCYNLKNQVCDEEFSMGASSFTNILKLNVNDTAYNMRTTNLKAMSTKKIYQEKMDPPLYLQNLFQQILMSLTTNLSLEGNIGIVETIKI